GLWCFSEDRHSPFTKFLCKQTQWREHRPQCFRTADCIKAKDTSFENPENMVFTPVLCLANPTACSFPPQ
ncbi:unnamed protein product, partial [Gulo gulo]